MSYRERQILHAFTYIWNFEDKTNKYSKTETDLQMREQLVNIGSVSERGDEVGRGN